MKALLSFTAGVAMAAMLAPTSAMANGNGLGIVGSPHDFATDTWNHRGEICRVCHVPHDHGKNTGDIGLLWNHQLSSATYLMYAEDSHINFLDSTIANGKAQAEPTGITKLCLGCHDGTVAIDEFDNKVGKTGVGFQTLYITDTTINGGGFTVPHIADVGSDKNLSNTHPLSIEYPANEVSNGTLRNPATTAMGPVFINDVLENGLVQCSSCHDVHNSPGEAVANTHLLRVGTTAATGGASALCLTCHIK